MRQQFNLWDHERESLNLWKALSLGTTRPSQNEGLSEYQRRASRLWTSPFPTGGRRQGGGERGKLGRRDCIPYQTANRLPVSNQRLPEILDGQHPPGGSQLEASSREQTQGACTRLAGRSGSWGWDHGGDKVHRTRGECARQAPGCLSCLGRRRHKTQAQPTLRFCGVPENWNYTQCMACSI